MKLLTILWRGTYRLSLICAALVVLLIAAMGVAWVFTHHLVWGAAAVVLAIVVVLGNGENW